MADYKQPSDVERRVRFFDGQYLQEQDFIDEQKYHIDRQRRHNRLLHVAGVADGLVVSKTGAAKVTVSVGTAIDSDGRQLVLLPDPQRVVDIPSALKSKTVCLYLVYKEDPADLQKQAGSEDNSRWLEKPDIKAVAKGEKLEFDYPPVLLAELTLDTNGAITGEINNAVREYSGLRLPGAGTDAPVLRTAAGGLVNLQGGLTVTGKVGIGTTSPGARLEVANYTLDNAAFQPLIRLLAHQKDESSSNVFDESKPSYGIEFYRRWNNVTTNIQAGIYAWATGNVGSGLAFRTKPSTGSGASLPTRMVITDGGNVGIGATDPKSTLSVKGGLAVGANYAGTNAAPDNGLLVEGNVGIGTITPKAFQVVLPESSKAGNAPGAGVTIAGGENASIELRGTGAPYIDFAKDATTTDYHARIRLTATDKLAIEGAKVGIGATDPKSTLSVKGGLAVGTNYAEKNPAPDNGLLVEGNSKLSGAVGINRDPIATQHLVIQPAKDNIAFNVTDPDNTKNWLSVFANGNVIMNGGKVGIGATAPGAKLEVGGTLTASANDEALVGLKIAPTFQDGGKAGVKYYGLIVAEGNVGIGTTAPKAFQVVLPETSKGGTAPGAGVTIAGGEHASIELRGTGTPYIDFAKDAATTDYHARIRLTATDKLAIEGAKVGIGTTEPKSALSVKGGLAVGTNYAGTNAAPDNGLLVEGNVGIGTTSPRGRLEVSGPTQTGTGTITSSGTTVTGNGTSLQTKLRVGDYITASGQTRTITAITSDTALTIDTAFAPNLAAGTAFTFSPLGLLVNNGKVGIGTTNPSEVLQLPNSAANSTVYICRKPPNGRQHDKNDAPSQLALGTFNSTFAGVRICSEWDGVNGVNQYIRFDTSHAWMSTDERMRIAPNGYVGIGATGPEAKLDVNGDAIVSGVIKGRCKEDGTREFRGYYPTVAQMVAGTGWPAGPAPLRSSVQRLVNQQAAVIQGFGATSHVNDTSRPPHLFAIGYDGDGNYTNSALIFDITTGAISYFKTFIIDHPLHQDKYLLHATLEGPEGAVYYRGTARLENGRAQVQLPDYFEALARAEGRTILLTNVDGFDALAVLTQDGAKIKDGRFIVVSSNKESNQVFDWEVKAIRKDAQALEVEPLKSAIKVERFGPYAYAVPANADRMRAQPLHAHPNIAGPQAGTGDIPGACGPRSKITNIR